MSDLYSVLYPDIEEHKRFFDVLVDRVRDDGFNRGERIYSALRALNFAATTSTGYYYSNELERFFVDIAQSLDIDSYDIPCRPKSMLHVLTKALTIGGHTRVVERWIQHLGEEYSGTVVLIDQGNDAVPPALADSAMHSGGTLVHLQSGSVIDKGLALRRLAMQYAYVILHTHMDDPVATIAFGTPRFTRPVLLFNHADHLFWIGKAVADMVLDFRTLRSISQTHRDIAAPLKCPIPAGQRAPHTAVDRAAARHSMGLTDQEKLVFLAGSDFKFTPICGDGIFSVLDEILCSMPGCKLCVVGPKPRDPNWAELHGRHPTAVDIKGALPFTEYAAGLAGADVVVDSYPMGGGTVLVDAVDAGVPFVALDTTIGQTDPVVMSEGFCQSKQELVDTTLRILHDTGYARRVHEQEKAAFAQENDVETWKATVRSILQAAPKRHSVRACTGSSKNIIDDYAAVLYALYKPRPKRLLDMGLLKILRVKNTFGSKYGIEVLGKRYGL